MAILKAYFDESESETHPFIVVAGYVSNEDYWTRFNHYWKEMLSDYGLSAFHMTDFIACQGEFRQFKGQPTKKAKCIERAIGIINRHPKIRISCSMELKHYAEVVKARDPNNPNITKAFSLCGMSCLAAIAYAAKAFGYNEEIAYTFEEGHRHCGDLVSTMNIPRLRSKFRKQYLTGTVCLGKKKALPPLQAADILAHQTCRCGVDGILKRHSKETYLADLHRASQGNAFVLDHNDLNKIVDTTVEMIFTREAFKRHPKTTVPKADPSC